MSAKDDRVAHLSDLLRKAEDARALAAAPVWSEAWEAIDKALIDDLLTCGATEDDKRFRLQTAIEVGRTMRRMIETKGATKQQVEHELAMLTGEKLRPVA
jgi:aspartate oxidase